MPKVIENNSSIMQESCLHHLSGKYLTEQCKRCQEDYDEDHHPNNYDCRFYEPRIQINIEKFVERSNGRLTKNGKNRMRIWLRNINLGLMEFDPSKCRGKLTIERIISNFQQEEYLEKV